MVATGDMAEALVVVDNDSLLPVTIHQRGIGAALLTISHHHLSPTDAPFFSHRWLLLHARIQFILGVTKWATLLVIVQTMGLRHLWPHMLPFPQQSKTPLGVLTLGQPII
ncbi:Hypothetical predicted protein [Olea europaea subsp. europaea]|uniref:Uncharacterized protein n=1 Tax=Olea europaea subsp. europaea TaxID=158383 RepID=A0A8S0QS52_OLEEU|nr:Hypothetical predicted protein [Olea europaea subsp. europaea]